MYRGGADVKSAYANTCYTKTVQGLLAMKIKNWLLAAALTSFMFVMAQSPTGFALSEGTCGDENTPYYTGMTSVEPGAYDVYVKLGRPGQTAVVTGSAYTNNDLVECETIGEVEASGNVWHKLGVYDHAAGDSEAFLQLSSAVLKDLPDANRPSLMLVSQANPVCVPTNECATTVAGQTAFIRPSSNLLGENMLRIVVAKDLSSDTVKRVRYYANNDFMYETADLQAFDMRSIPYYASTMTRVIDYGSGQTAVVQSEVPIDHVDSFGSALVRTVRKYQNTIVLAVIIIGAVVLIRLVRAAVIAARQRRFWLEGHGLAKPKSAMPAMPEAIKREQRKQVALRAYSIFERVVVLGGIVVVLVLVVTAYAGQIASVNGESMVSSYQNGQKVFVNKLPVTFAQLNHAGFVPKRGEVVVAHPSYGASMDAAEAADEMIIKRVIGLPGERIEIRNGAITVFNNEHPDGFDPSAGTVWEANVQADESLDVLTVTLTENELFLVGDNRPASIDSRFNGPISSNQLIGVVVQ